MRIESTFDELDEPAPEFWGTHEGGFASISPKPPTRFLRTLPKWLFLKWKVYHFDSDAADPHGFRSIELVTVAKNEIRGPVNSIDLIVQRMREEGYCIGWRQNLAPNALAIDPPSNDPLRKSTERLVHRLRQNWRGVLIARSQQDIEESACVLPLLLPRAQILYVFESRDRLKHYQTCLSQLYGDQIGSVLVGPDNHDRRVYLSRSTTFNDSVSRRYDVVVWPQVTDLLTEDGRVAAWSLDFFRRRVFTFRLPNQVCSEQDRRFLRLLIGADMPLQASTEFPCEVFCSEARSGEEPECDKLNRTAAVAKTLVGETCRNSAGLGVDLETVHECRRDFEPDVAAVLVKNRAQGRRLSRRLTGWPVFDIEAANGWRPHDELPRRAIVTVAFVAANPHAFGRRTLAVVLSGPLADQSPVRQLLKRIGAPVLYA